MFNGFDERLVQNRQIWEFAIKIPVIETVS